MAYFGAGHYSAERWETGGQKAERIVRQELKRRGWKEQNLQGLSKGDKSRVALARRLRQETTMTFKWMARRQRMGGWTHVSIVRTDTAPVLKKPDQKTK